MNELPLIERAKANGGRTAFRESETVHSYGDLVDRSHELATALLAGRDDLEEARVALLAAPGFAYAAAQWAIWRAGGIVVPLSLSATSAELEYTLQDSRVSIVLTTREWDDAARPLAEKLDLSLLVIEACPDHRGALPEVDPSRRAMILYTSGTTSAPKGVVTTHANIEAQIRSLVDDWKWQAEDRIPLFLPLHHIHGIINVLSCALWSGALIEPFRKFEVEPVLKRVSADAYTVFMAVPTIYVKLIQHLASLSETEREAVCSGFRGLRLMISGSAALPASVHRQWTALTGQSLLERYGMTEIGMALSNPYWGERRPGMVGQALSEVVIRLWGESGGVIESESEPGEIQVRGPGVFLEYWNRPQVTSESFQEGWFRTGDVAVLEDGYYRILGRQSVDIIKSGGYKLSALEIEAALLQHTDVLECAVVGIPDDVWGEAVMAAIVVTDRERFDVAALTDWCRSSLSKYKIPKQFLVVDALPRNAMGKVTKPAVRELFGPDQVSGD